MKRKITTMLMAVMMIVALTPFMAHAYEYPWGDGSGAEIMEFIYFFDADGSLLHIQRTAHGQIPVYNGETPTKPSDANYTYTFAGWDPELKPAEGPMSYAATYTRTEKKDPVFSVSANSITYGEDATISATLPNDATGSFQVTVVEDSTGNERKEAAEVKNGGAEAHDEIKANSQRSDVDNVHHCGDHHGFTAVIPTDKRGEQTVYIYAKYIGSGKTELIGSKTVTITGPTPALTQDPTKVAVPGGRTLIYNSKAQTGVASGKGYTLSGTKSATKAGSYQAKATLKEGYVWKDGTTAAKTIKWKINKAANTLRIKARTANVKYSAVKKKNQVLGVTKVLTITNKGKGAKTYIKKSGNAKITIAKTTGKVTVKKGLKKGTYKVKVKVKAAGNANYKASAWKTVTFKIKVTAK